MSLFLVYTYTCTSTQPRLLGLFTSIATDPECNQERADRRSPRPDDHRFHEHTARHDSSARDAARRRCGASAAVRVGHRPQAEASGERCGVGVVCAHYHDNLARRRPDNNRWQLAPRRDRGRRVDESASRCLALGAADGLDHANSRHQVVRRDRDGRRGRAGSRRSPRVPRRLGAGPRAVDDVGSVLGRRVLRPKLTRRHIYK